MLNFLPLLLLLSSLPFLTAQISCSTSTFFTNNALKLPNGLIGSPAFNASIDTYPNGTTFIYYCPAIDIQIGETTQLLDINRLYMSIDPIQINPHRGELFRFYCLEGEWRYNIQPSLNPSSDGLLSDFNTVLMNVPNECRAPDYCVRPPKALGLHTLLIARPPATGTPTFWSANAKVRQENPSLINQEYTYNFTCEPGYILRDGDGNDVAEQIVPLTCSGGQNFYEWDCTIPGAPVGSSCRATKRYKCEAIETCDGSIFNNFPLSTDTSGSIPSSTLIYPYNTHVTTLTCNTTYPSAIFDSIHPTSASQPISTSQSMTFTCQRSKVNGDWKTRWVYIVDGISYDYDQYRLGCYATTQCMSPPSFNGIITSLEPVRFPFPINDVRDYVARCGPNQRMVLASSSLDNPIPVYAPRGLPLVCVGGSLQWDCQSSSNAFPHAITESSCMSRVRCDAGCPLSSIYDKKYNNGMSLPRAINHTLGVDYDVALPGTVIKLNCLNGWFFSNLMDDKVNEMTATCRIDSVTSRPFRWEIFPNTFKKWRCAAPGICIDDPNFNDVGSPRLIPYDSSVGNLTIQDGTQLGIWDYSDPNTKHVSFRAICPLVGYERQPVDPNTGEQDWALGGINITCGNTFDIPNWRCPGLLSSKGDCGNANLWDKAVCIRYFCAPTQDRLKDPRYNSTLTSEDTLRIGDRLPSLTSKMFTSTVEKITQQVIPVGTHIPVGCGDTSYRLYLVDGTNDAPDLGPTGSVFSYLRFKHIPTNSLGWNAVETDGATCAATSKLDTFYQERVPFYIDMFDRQLPWYQYQSLYNTDGYAITYDRGFFSCQLPRCFAPIITAPHLNAYDSGGKLIPRDAIRTFPLNTNVSLGCSRGYDMWRVYVNDDIPISRTTDTIDSSRISEEMLSRLQPQVSHITSAKTQCVEQVPRARPGTTQIMAFDGVTELGRRIEDGWSIAEGKWFRHVNRTGGIQYGYYECRPQVCTISQNPAPGTIVSHTSGFEGDNITFTCEAGWELPPGSNGIATCYSQEFLPSPQCIPGACPTLTIPNAYPLMGRKNDTVNVTCAEGFRYNRTEGNVYTVTCQQDQTWSSTVSRCIPVICPDVIAPPHSYISDGGNSSEHYIHAFDNHVTSRVYLRCEAGYEYKDVNRTMMECMINGRWNNTLTICVPSTCNKIPQRLYSTLTTSTGTLRDTEYVAGTHVNMTCDAGYKRNDNDTAITTSIACIKDENGARWERAFPNCTAVACPPAVLKSLSSTVDFYNRDVTGTVVGFTCPPKTMLPTNVIDRITCVGTTWTPNKPITCVPKPCPTLSQPDGGRLSATTGLPGATVRVECKDAKGVYKFKQTITCTADLTWSPSLPVCLGSNANVGNHLVISFITFISSILTTIILI